MAFKVKIIGLHQACFITLVHKECERLENEPKQKECITLAFEKEQSSSCVSLCIFITGASLTVHDIADMQCQKLLCTSSGWPCHLAISLQPRVRGAGGRASPAGQSAPAPAQPLGTTRRGCSLSWGGVFSARNLLTALLPLINRVAMQCRECGSPLSTEEQSYVDFSWGECGPVALELLLFSSSESSPDGTIP